MYVSDLVRLDWRTLDHTYATEAPCVGHVRRGKFCRLFKVLQDVYAAQGAFDVRNAKHVLGGASPKPFLTWQHSKYSTLTSVLNLPKQNMS
jgi:hypothetical protein